MDYFRSKSWCWVAIQNCSPFFYLIFLGKKFENPIGHVWVLSLPCRLNQPVGLRVSFKKCSGNNHTLLSPPESCGGILSKASFQNSTMHQYSAFLTWFQPCRSPVAFITKDKFFSYKSRCLKSWKFFGKKMIPIFRLRKWISLGLYFPRSKPATSTIHFSVPNPHRSVLRVTFTNSCFDQLRNTNRVAPLEKIDNY